MAGLPDQVVATAALQAKMFSEQVKYERQQKYRIADNDEED